VPESRHRRVSRALQEQRRRWAVVRFSLLSTVLVLSLGLVMIVAPFVQSRALFLLAITAPLLIGVYVVSESPRFAVAWGSATVLTVLLGVFALVRQDRELLIGELAIRGALLLALIAWIVREMLREERVSLDTILGGICIYLLIGYTYTFVYLMLLLADPHAFVAGDQVLDASLTPDHPFRTVPSLFYFSFTAFTTMGFGDIVPVSAAARYATITEGMVGQLYPAIFIARLVSLSLLDRAGPPGGGAG